MRLSYHIKTAYRGISTNRSRSLLTILGIVIGIASIIIVMSIGQGAQNLILKQIEGLGTQTVSINPGKEADSFMGIRQNSLTERDVEALKRASNVQGVTDVSPMVSYAGVIVSEEEKVRASVIGFSELIEEIFSAYPEKGTSFSKEEVDQRARVAVLGKNIAEDLFGQSDVVGQRIRINEQSFRVLGTFASKMSLFGVDDMIIVPYTTAQQDLTGSSYYDQIIVRVEEGHSLDRAVSDITSTLLETHNIDNPDDADFFTSTQADAIESVSVITNILTALLSSVAAISLVVGGIGIMNIMLVSVTERTREIGLRKALGATEGNILSQFLFEAVMLTGLGGIIGILLGALFSFAVAVVLSQALGVDWDFTFPVFAAFLGISVSAAIGLVFGIYPARAASRKSPMEALRSE